MQHAKSQESTGTTVIVNNISFTLSQTQKLPIISFDLDLQAAS